MLIVLEMGKFGQSGYIFKTSSNDFKPTEFVYFGDAQIIF